MQYVKLILAGACAIIIGVVVSSDALAMQTRVDATNTKSGKTLVIPEHAVQVADNVFSLGSAVDPTSGKVVEGYMIVQRADAHAKPDGTPGNGGKKGGSGSGSSCYAFIGNGAKWKAPEPWIVNPSNTYGIADASVLSILSNGASKWEDAANGAVGDGISANIFEGGSATSGILTADEAAPDNQNEVYFSPIANPNTIAVTIVWGIFRGPASARELVEWDQVYNTYYSWSDTGTAGAMDFDNIATHELGHSVGLDDLYDAGCSNETMYGVGTHGETKKRDLEAGDIAGVSQLYS